MVTPDKLILWRMIYHQESGEQLRDAVDPSVFQTNTSRKLFLILSREVSKGASPTSLRPILQAEAPACVPLFDELGAGGEDYLDADDSNEMLVEAAVAWGRLERFKRATEEAQGGLNLGGSYDEVRNRLDKQLAAIDSSSLEDVPFDDKADMQRRVNEFLANDNQGGLKFGFSRLDKRVTPMMIGNMTLICGRPGTGKSTIMRNIARNAVKIYKEPTAYFSLEMVGEETLPWFACMDTGIAYTDYVERNLSKWDRTRFDTALDEWVKNPLFLLNERAEVSPEWALRTIKRYAAMGYVNIIFDHFHRVDYGVKPSDMRLAVAEFGKRFKTAMVTLRRRGIAGCQLTKGDPHEEPGEEYIRETGNLIDEADKIFLTWMQKVVGQRRADGTFMVRTALNGARTLAQDAQKGEEVGEDDGRVYLKVGKQRVRKIKGFIAVPYNSKSGLMYEDEIHSTRETAA